MVMVAFLLGMHKKWQRSKEGCHTITVVSGKSEQG